MKLIPDLCWTLSQTIKHKLTMNDPIYIVDHNKFRSFNYTNNPSANLQLGQILIDPKTNEIGVIIQTHSSSECRTDMFGNCDANEVCFATLQEIKEHRPELISDETFTIFFEVPKTFPPLQFKDYKPRKPRKPALPLDYNQMLQDAAAQMIDEIENGNSDSLLKLLKTLSIKDLKGFLPVA